jgi:hypothetical protein
MSESPDESSLVGAWYTAMNMEGKPTRHCPYIIEFFDDGRVERNHFRYGNPDTWCSFLNMGYVDRPEDGQVFIGNDALACRYRREGELLRMACKRESLPADFVHSLLLRPFEPTPLRGAGAIEGQWRSVPLMNHEAYVLTIKSRDLSFAGKKWSASIDDTTITLSGANQSKCRYRATPRRLTLRCSPDLLMPEDLGDVSWVFHRLVPEVDAALAAQETRLGHTVAADTDGDGYQDHLEACPNDPEDFDGFEDNDGCPDVDNDRDGVLDRNDECPNQAEDRDAYEDEDGCPESNNVDRDGDGVEDEADACPDDPEDMDSYEDGDGCPDPDNDRDGILDVDDLCPNDREDIDGFEDQDGCPDK